MIGILTSGLPPASDPSVAHPVLRVHELPSDPSTDPFRHLADAVGPALRRGVTVLALLPAWDADPLHAQLEAVRSSFETTSLVIRTTSLPPLAAAVFAETVAEIANRGLLPVGALLSVLPRLERHVRAAAWLGSVARLREPAPTLGLHARSYVPGAGFAAVVGETSSVRPLKRNETTMPLPEPTIAGRSRVVLAHGAKVDVELARHSLGQSVPDAEVATVPLSPISTGWWGTGKLVELAFAPTDLAALVAAVTVDLRSATCAWCGADVRAPAPCPYCGDDRTDDPFAGSVIAAPPPQGAAIDVAPWGVDAPVPPPSGPMVASVPPPGDRP